MPDHASDESPDPDINDLPASGVTGEAMPHHASPSLADVCYIEPVLMSLPNNCRHLKPPRDDLLSREQAGQLSPDATRRTICRNPSPSAS